MVAEKRSITLDSGMVRRVEELAEKERRSFSNMIGRILEEYFKIVESAKG